MNRREVISLGAAMSLAGVLPRAAAQPVSKAAIVVGVDRIEGLQPLKAAADARRIADWLGNEGFAISLFTDEQQPVARKDVFRAVRDVIAPGSLEMLVIYFAGHGFVSGANDLLLLSDAPGDPAEALNLNENVNFARNCGVPNVVMIADACRSASNNPNIARLTGNVVFPNAAIATGDHAVDELMATTFGSPAYEQKLVDAIAERGGIFTASLLEAFHEPRDDMILTLPSGDKVVPNARLKDFVRTRVAEKVEELGINFRQSPQIFITSDDDTYLGRVISTQRSAPQPSVVPPPTPIEILDSELRDLPTSFRNDTTRDIRVASIEIDPQVRQFAIVRDEVMATTPIQSDHQPGSTVTVSGTRIETVLTDGRVRVTPVATRSAAGPSAYRFEIPDRARFASALVMFADGAFTIQPVLRDFNTSIVVSEGGVASVQFVPNQASDRWSEYESVKDRVEQLHALVAAAAGIGGFRIEGDQETRARRAERMGDDIRLQKSNDPTLAIYAAYAYTQAGLPEKARSVADFMRSDLGFDFFDLAMLAGSLSGSRRQSVEELAPLCPMLTQGWDFLRLFDVRSPIDLQTARGHLRPALWTTLEPDAVRMFQRIIEHQSHLDRP